MGGGPSPLRPSFSFLPLLSPCEVKLKGEEDEGTVQAAIPFFPPFFFFP